MVAIALREKQPLGPVLRHLGWISFSFGKPTEKLFSKPLLSDIDDAIESWTNDKSDASPGKSLTFMVEPSGKS